MPKTWAVLLVVCFSCSALGVARSSTASTVTFQADADGEGFSQEQLDNLLAPIALYPDPLLAQVLLAATFVDQIDEAARFVRANGQAGIDDQDWDVSVKAVAHYPAVLDMLADKIDWTTSLGQAYVAQSTDAMMAVQRLRRMARSQGNLDTTEQQEVVDDNEDIRIVPAQPTFIYVPHYLPSVVYYRRPASGFAISFGIGFAIGAWLNDDFDWHARRVYYHGWTGGGWIGRCRPHVRVTTVYVSPRYANVRFNTTIVDRHVNYVTLNRYNAVHRTVTYDHVRVRGSVYVESRPHETRPASGNAVINRNIDTRDGQLDRYRGHEETRQAHPTSEIRGEPAKAKGGSVATAAETHAGPHAYGKTETNQDANQASRRGQASREAAKTPPQHTTTEKSTSHVANAESHSADKKKK